MKIGLNLLYLLPGVVGGTETYAVELIRALSAVDRENEYLVYVNRESDGLDLVEAPNFRLVRCAVTASVRAIRYGWEQALLPWQLAAARVDLVHSLGYVGPVAAPCRSVVTIHDANFVRLRDAMPGMRNRALSYCSLRSARAADRVITVSGFSKRELVTGCGLPEDKVCVIQAGPGAGVAETAQDGDAGAAPGGPYLAAFCGSPHKNAVRLVRAFERIAGRTGHKLVFIGRPSADLARTLADLPDRIRERVLTPGHVSRSTVVSLLRGCELFVFPSLYEGFGLPILEAQALGAPVACSTAGSLPEVASVSAEYFDPESVVDIAATLGRCLSDPGLTADLRRRGAINVGRFSWRKAAEETLEVYRSVAGLPQLARRAAA